MFELRDVRADVVISFYPCVSPLCVTRTCVVIGLGRYAAFQLVPSDGWDDIGCDTMLHHCQAFMHVTMSNAVTIRIIRRAAESPWTLPSFKATNTCTHTTPSQHMHTTPKTCTAHTSLPTLAHATLAPSRRFLSDPSLSCSPTPPFHTTAANSTSGTYGHHPTCFNSTKLQCRSRASCAAPTCINVAHHTVTCRCAE